MTESEFTQIASYALETEAGHCKSILEENDIAAFIDGAAASEMLSYVGSAIGGVKLFVRTADRERAVEILGLGDDKNVGDVGADWFCGECEEEVEANFQVCWSCGKQRSEVEQPFPAATSEKIDSEAVDNSEEAEAMLQRAWRASIIGLGLFPVLTHFYSMYLLWRATSLDNEFSTKGKKLFYRTFCFNVAAVCFYGTVLNWAFRN